MENENKCYKQFLEPKAIGICLNSTNIEPYCGYNLNPEIFPYTSKTCPEKSTSKNAYHQCYNTIGVSSDEYGPRFESL